MIEPHTLEDHNQDGDISILKGITTASRLMEGRNQKPKVTKEEEGGCSAALLKKMAQNLRKHILKPQPPNISKQFDREYDKSYGFLLVKGKK